jgi:hypothetical protein
LCRFFEESTLAVCLSNSGSGIALFSIFLVMITLEINKQQKIKFAKKKHLLTTIKPVT